MVSVIKSTVLQGDVWQRCGGLPGLPVQQEDGLQPGDEHCSSAPCNIITCHKINDQCCCNDKY